LDSPLYDTTAFIPANYNYLTFELSSEEQVDSHPESIIAPFQSHSITLGELLEDLLNRNGLIAKYPMSKMNLTLKNETKIPQE
jgi:hypothetical protein